MPDFERECRKPAFCGCFDANEDMEVSCEEAIGIRRSDRFEMFSVLLEKIAGGDAVIEDVLTIDASAVDVVHRSGYDRVVVSHDFPLRKEVADSFGGLLRRGRTRRVFLDYLGTLRIPRYS